jgi:hypothetical protein
LIAFLKIIFFFQIAYFKIVFLLKSQIQMDQSSDGRADGESILPKSGQTFLTFHEEEAGYDWGYFQSIGLG